MMPNLPTTRSEPSSLSYRFRRDRNSSRRRKVPPMVVTVFGVGGVVGGDAVVRVGPAEAGHARHLSRHVVVGRASRPRRQLGPAKVRPCTAQKRHRAHTHTPRQPHAHNTEGQKGQRDTSSSLAGNGPLVSNSVPFQ